MERRPTDAEVSQFIARLGDWISSQECDELVRSFALEHGNFARGLGKTKIWREAYHAVLFAHSLHASQLKLGSDPPDFYFSFEGRIVPVELVVARDLDDMTGAAFLAATALGAGQHDIQLSVQDQEELDRSWRALPARVAEMVEKKAAKAYPCDFRLAVAASSWWWPSEDSWMVEQIREAITPYLDKFAEIWLHAGGRFVSYSNPR